MDDLVKWLRDDALERMHGLGKPDGPAIEDQAADEIHGLWQAIDCARHSTGYAMDDIGPWFDHFFPKKPGQPPPFDMTDPRQTKQLWSQFAPGDGE